MIRRKTATLLELAGPSDFTVHGTHALVGRDPVVMGCDGAFEEEGSERLENGTPALFDPAIHIVLVHT